MDLYKSFCIGTTFLTPDMNFPESKWLFTGPFKIISGDLDGSPMEDPVFLEDLDNPGLWRDLDEFT